jgi:thiol-disulfide isomerase/thioredoxin
MAERTTTRNSGGIATPPILVSHATEAATPGLPNYYANEQEAVSSRMKIINKTRVSLDIEDITAQFLQDSIRPTTKKAYDNGWRKWCQWCQQQQPSINPTEYNARNVVNFLAYHQQYSTQHLNTIRSTIVSIFNKIHHQLPPIVEHPLVRVFFFSKTKQRNKIAKQSTTRNMGCVPFNQTSAKEIFHQQQFVITSTPNEGNPLLCIATMWHPHSDIGRLQHRDTIFGKRKSRHYKCDNSCKTSKRSTTEDHATWTRRRSTTVPS